MKLLFSIHTFINNLLFFQIVDTLKASGDFKNKQQKCIMFFDMLKYVYSESVFNTLYIDIKHKS